MIPLPPPPPLFQNRTRCDPLGPPFCTCCPGMGLPCPTPSAISCPRLTLNDCCVCAHFNPSNPKVPLHPKNWLLGSSHCSQPYIPSSSSSPSPSSTKWICEAMVSEK